jgi:hypothetical protein
MKKAQFEEYVVGDYTDEKKDEAGKTITKRTRYRVSVIRGEAAQAKRIIKDGFETEEEATAYAEECRQEKQKR